MRKGFFVSVILIACILPQITSAQFEWDDPIILGAGAAPDLDIDKNTGELHIVSMIEGVIYTKTDSAGNILIQEEVVSLPGDEGDFRLGVAVAVDLDGNPHMVFRDPLDFYNFRIYYMHRAGGGWSPTLDIAGAIVYRGYNFCIDVDSQYRAHVTWGIEEQDSRGTASYVIIENRRIILRQNNLAWPNFYRTDSRLEIDTDTNDMAHLLIGCPIPESGPVSYFRSEFSGGYLMYIDDIHAEQCSGRNGTPDVFVDAANKVHMIYGSQQDFDAGGQPSIRYLRYENGTQVVHQPANNPGWLESWKNGQGWGTGSVAASADGQYVAVAYLSQPNDELYVTLSTNGGTTWRAPDLLATNMDGFEDRSKQVIRAHKNNFYVVYPHDGQIKLRTLLNAGDTPPVADAGGPYTSVEGTAVQLDASASQDQGANAEIIEYAWDWDNDGSFDETSTNPLISRTYTDDYSGQVVLRVKDRAWNVDYDTTTIQIDNLPPSTDAGLDHAINEGDGVTFSCTITDPGEDDTHTRSWNFGDGSQQTGNDLQHVFRDNGVYQVIVTVTDDDGGADADTVVVTVANVAPTVDAGGPYTSPVGQVITFTGSIIDPGLDDTHDTLWDLDNNGTYESTGLQVTKSFPALGEYVVAFVATDDDGGVGADTAMVRIKDDTPVISPIADQTIAEGGNFTPILLDDFVEDPYQPDNQLAWNITGQVELLVSLDNRILTVAPPDSEWIGIEIMTLTVTDPRNFSDSTQVTFSVTPVNDPPFWGKLPDFTFNEDDTLKLTLDTLRSHISDIDDDVNNLQFLITENDDIHWSLLEDEEIICFWAPADWFGFDDIVFVAVDTSGATAMTQSRLTVTGVNDPPYPFSLIDPLYISELDWPDSLTFSWHKALDPDAGSFVYYEWTLWSASGSATDQTRTVTLFDTVYTFIPDANLKKGNYFWRANALDQESLSRESTNIGILIIGENTSVETDIAALPREFDLLPNYPNPFNPETHITFHLPEKSQVRLAVYNTLGQEVRVLEEGLQKAGIHTVTWNGRNQFGQPVPSGIYLCRLVAGSHSFLRKMTLIQ